MTEEELNQQLAITGAGGGGGKGGGDGDTDPPEDGPDTLQSRSTAKVVVAVCEGKIEGFPGGNADKLKRVYLNNTQIQTETGGSNFQLDDIRVSNLRLGERDQDPLNGFDDLEIEQSVDVRVTKEGGQTSVTTIRSDLDRVRVRVGVGALYEVDRESGDINGSRLRYKIKIKDSVSDGNIVNNDYIIDGKSRGPFEEEREFALTGTGPWTVTVRRETNDSDRTTLVNDLYFKAIIGIIGSKFIYPRTAVLGLEFNAQSFSSIPKVSMMLKGKLIQVPSNYDPNRVDDDFQSAYTGTWDGTFHVRYSNNPAWIFYDLLTNSRYGCGDFMREEDIDKFALYDIGYYCDGRVPDGRGGRERRFTFNGHINNRGEAYDVLNSIAATFRGMLYYHQGTVVAVQDSPANAVKVFTPANVIQEVDDSGNVTGPPFTYEGTGRKTRKTVCLVSWNDPTDRYKSKVEYVEDRSAVEKYGHRELEVRAFGCTSQGQAQRVGKWNLFTNLTETETVSFKVSAEGFFLLPGEIIEIGDPSKQGSGVAAGYVKQNTDSNTIYLDRTVTLRSGVAYELHCVINGRMRFRAVSTSAGSHTRLTVNPAFGTRPDVGGMWVLKESTDTENLRQYRVIGVQEVGDGTVQVMAVQHNKDKYRSIDRDTLIQTQSASAISVGSVPSVDPGSISVGFT